MVVKLGEIDVSAEALKNQQGPLSEDQAEAIALESIKEAEANDPELKKKREEEAAAEVAAEAAAKAATAEVKEEGQEEGAPAKETALSDEELLSADDSKLTDELKAKKATLVEANKVKEEERLINAKEEDLSAEDKPKRAEILKVREEKKSKEAEQEIADYAKEHNVSVEEARDDLESIAKIQEKYKSDPKQLAKANLFIQRTYSKTEAELKALKEAAPSLAEQELTIDGVLKLVDDGKIKDGKGNAVTREIILGSYRKAYPELTDTLEDEEVLKLAAKDFKEKIVTAAKSGKEELVVKAKEKRATIFDTVPEADKKFIPEIKPLVEKLSDEKIMDANFDLGTYITYVKGKVFDTTFAQLEKEKAEFGAKEYTRGLEEAKILGVKRPPDGKPPVKKSVTLNEEQKQRAREMFDNPDITEEKAYQLYADYLVETGQAKT